MAGSEVYDVRDERFGALIAGSAVLEELYRGCRWAEGPVWFSDLNCLLWSDIPNERMMRWVPDGTVSVFRSPSNYVNGNTRDRQGRLVSCEHGGRR
ncbi:MAG: SMP-30/gluconolactonase/LRE family protein, partial [Rhizobium sp.]